MLLFSTVLKSHTTANWTVITYQNTVAV